MSVRTGRTYTITFTSKEEKTKAIGFLLHADFAFKGVGIDTIEIAKDAHDALVEKNIKFQQVCSN